MGIDEQELAQLPDDLTSDESWPDDEGESSQDRTKLREWHWSMVLRSWTLERGARCVNSRHSNRSWESCAQL